MENESFKIEAEGQILNWQGKAQLCWYSLAVSS